jgi:uncharacterized OsmC-like protein
MPHSINVAPANIVNGIDVDDVQHLIEQVKTDPANGMTHWSVSSAWQGGTRSRAKVQSYGIGGVTVPRTFTIETDEPAELGGSNQYANPQEYLIAALNACMTVGYAALCALHGIRLEKLEIVTEGDIDLRGFLALEKGVSPGYDTLRTRVIVKADATPERLREIHEMVMATSPNVHNITKAIQIEAALLVE